MRVLMLLLLGGFGFAGEMTVERLYQLPWVVGTEPTGMVWSPDGRHCAFLWNDEGFPFRDVWVFSPDDPKPRRLTRFAPEPPATPASPDVAALKTQEQFENNAGLRQLWWLDDGRVLIARGGDFWTVDLKGSLVRVDQTRGPELRPAISKDHLVYVRGGDLYRRAPADLSKEERLTKVAKPTASVAQSAISADGSRIAFILLDRSNVKRRIIPDYLGQETRSTSLQRPYPGEPVETRKLGVVPSSGGDVVWVDLPIDAEDFIWDFQWHPRENRLLVDVSDYLLDDRQLLSVDGISGQVTLLQRFTDAKNLDPSWDRAWSNDGSRIWILSSHEDGYHLYSAEAKAGADLKRHTRGDWEIAQIQTVPKSNKVLMVANQGAAQERHLLVYEDGQAPQRLTQTPGTHQPVWSPDGRYAATHFSSDLQPPDLVLIDTKDGKRTPVTQSPRADFKDFPWVAPEYVTFNSHVDGTTLHGRLTLPKMEAGKRYPVVLGSVYVDSVRNQFGGRRSHPTWGFDQILVAKGYIVLNVNMRGSWGHGKTFRDQMHQGYGVIDIEDIESAVRWLKSRDDVDGDRIGIWGSSYGGLMTAMSLFKKPGLFACGIAGAPATNVRHAFPQQMWVMQRPEGNDEAYDNSSPLQWAAGLEDPLMIIHGMRDGVVFYGDSLQLVYRLQLMGKDVDLLTLPNAGHGWDNEGLAQTRFAFNKMLEFFDRHLKHSSL